jgi:predicted ATPase/class 3 adenylate cyclase
MGPLRCFLFTDIEGSSPRWDADQDEMAGLLAHHDRVVRDAVVRSGGRVFSTGGDGFGVAFDDVTGAIGCALGVQDALTQDPLRVRMGIHVGEASERDNSFFGPTLNRAARLMSAGHGGQVLLSDATAALARPSLPADTTLVDLGVHRLRGLVEPERVWQLRSATTPESFPALRTADPVVTNLPLAGGLVGRDDDVAQVLELVRAQGVVTITGPGGVGKSRLALAAASGLVDEFADGCWLVELGTLDDPGGLVGAVAAPLPLPTVVGTAGDLVGQLRSSRLLLVLDNCEHLIDAVAELVAAIGSACSEVRILCSSREAVGVEGERLWPLRPLAFDDAAVLFMERARAVRPDVPDDPRPMGEIARRLDGLPLAIELAAARVVTLSPADIAARLDDRFRILAGGRRARQPRHRTLRAMVDWSHELLSPEEQVLFRRLGVFAGDLGLDGASAVASGGQLDRDAILDCLDALVRQSLVVADLDGSETWYRLLETMRQYALERLAEAGESERTARRHAEWYAERVGHYRGVWSPDEAVWLARAGREFDNFRAAVRFALDDGDADLAVRLVGPLYRITYLHRYELADWANDVLAVPGADIHPQVGHVHLVIARLAWAKGDLDIGEAAVDRALRCALDEDAWALATAIRAVILSLRGRLDKAAAVLTEALERPLSAANRAYLAASLLWAGQSSTTAADRLDPFAVIADADVLRVPFLRSFARSGAAAFLTLEDRVDEAVPLFAEAADIARASGNRYALRLALTFGDVASGRLLDAQVDTDADVAGRARRALEISHEFSSGFVAYLVGLVLAAHRAGQADDAALVAGYLSTHGDDLGVAAATVERLAAGGSLARFAEGDAAASYERGRTLTTDQLLAVLEQLAT